MGKFATALLVVSIVTTGGQAALASSTDRSDHQQQEIGIDYATLLVDQDIDYFIQKADQFIANHPTATLEQINQFVKKEMRERYRDKVKTNSTMDYPIPVDPSMLNDQEKALYNSNPYYGLLSIDCGKIARDEAIVRYQSHTLVSGNGDAFRHAFWNAMMVNTTTEDWANKWATAHEEGDSSNDYLNKTMDLSNNSRGRQIGLANLTHKSNFRNSLAPKVILQVDAGKMIRIVSDQLVTTDSSGKL